MRIGVDVGGTNTDAVLVDGRDVLAEAKTPTTRGRHRRHLVGAPRARRVVGRRRPRVQAVMIGTTHFTNAVVERGGSRRPPSIRLGLPATRGAAADGRLAGRAARRARRRRLPLPRRPRVRRARDLRRSTATSCRAVAADFAAKGIRTVAISSVFSPVNAEAEQEAAAIARRGAARRGDLALARDRPDRPARARERGDHERLPARAGRADRGRLPRGARRARDRRAALPEPERRHADGGRLRRALPGADLRVRADELDARRRLPLRPRATARSSTSAARPPTSACLQHGFPREASVAVEIGGVRTNFRMPDVLSLGLGGGSHRRDGALRSGPQSVGYELTSRALVFGGDDADGDRPRRRGRARRDRRRDARRRARAARAGARADRGADRRDRRPDEDERRADPGHRRRRRLDPPRATAAGRVASSSSRSTSRSRTRSAPRSRRSAARSTRSSRSRARPARRGDRGGQGGGDREGGRRRRRARHRPRRRRRGRAARLPRRRTRRGSG